jgi:hypothetical protein
MKAAAARRKKLQRIVRVSSPEELDVQIPYQANITLGLVVAVEEMRRQHRLMYLDRH